MGTFTAIADLGSGMGSFMMGIILQLTSYPIMFSCLTLTGIINFLYFYFIVRKKTSKPPLPSREGIDGRERYANL
jgi:high-affinity Fe2+/Pb2+ permease